MAYITLQIDLDLKYNLIVRLSQTTAFGEMLLKYQQDSNDLMKYCRQKQTWENI